MTIAAAVEPGHPGCPQNGSGRNPYFHSPSASNNRARRCGHTVRRRRVSGAAAARDRAREEWVAIAAVLRRAVEPARSVERLLELEAADPRVEELHAASRALRAAISALASEVEAGIPTPGGVNAR